MKKRGQSEVITTVLIILLVIAAVFIVYVVVRNMVSSGAEKVNTSTFDIQLKTSATSLTLSQVNVSVTREAGEGKLDSIRIIFRNATTSWTYEVTNNLPEELESRTYSIKFTEADISDVQSYEVYPVSKSGNKEVIGLKAIQTSGTSSPRSGTTTPPVPSMISITQAIYDSGPQPYVLDEENGVYSVDTDISVGSGNAFNVGANHVTLICNGNTILGNPGGSSRGIDISFFNYTTIKDCTISGFFEGIYINYANYTIARDNVIYPGVYPSGSGGIHVAYGYDNSLLNNIIGAGFERGILAEYTNNLNVKNNDIVLSSTFQGIGLYAVANSFVYNNTLKAVGIAKTGTSVGILVAGGTGKFEENNVSEYYNGIKLDGFAGGTFKSNHLCGNAGADVVCVNGEPGTWVTLPGTTINTNNCTSQYGSCGFTCALCN